MKLKKVKTKLKKVKTKLKEVKIRLKVLKSTLKEQGRRLPVLRLLGGEFTDVCPSPSRKGRVHGCMSLSGSQSEPPLPEGEESTSKEILLVR
jgi:hypothetical protein